MTEHKWGQLKYSWCSLEGEKGHSLKQQTNPELSGAFQTQTKELIERKPEGSLSKTGLNSDVIPARDQISRTQTVKRWFGVGFWPQPTPSPAAAAPTHLAVRSPWARPGELPTTNYSLETDGRQHAQTHRFLPTPRCHAPGQFLVGGAS